MRFIFHPEALSEYEQATIYYSKISKQLAVSFIDCIEMGIKKILEYPGGWQTIEEDVRRLLIKRFPFGIYYTIESDHVLIVAVMHMSREPEYWIERLHKSNG